jgi:O-antigen/teichoic acid export membrane protein
MTANSASQPTPPLPTEPNSNHSEQEEGAPAADLQAADEVYPNGTVVSSVPHTSWKRILRKVTRVVVDKGPQTWPSRVRRLKELLLTPNDLSTEDGRSRERYRKAAVTSITTFLARGLEALVSLISIPLTISYLGKSRYGMWVAINALLMWGALADFGLGRGLQNRLSEAYGKNDEKAASQYVGTAFFSLSGIALFFGITLGPLIFLVPWSSVFNIQDNSLQSEAPWTVLAVLFVFLFHFPLGIVGQIYAAYQRGYIANFFTIAGNVLSMITLLVVIQLKLGLPWLIFARGGVGMLLTIVNLFYVVSDMPFLRPRWSEVSRSAFDHLVKLSVPMFVFQIGALLINEVQLLIIAHVRNLSEVTDYSIFIRVFSLPVLAISFIDGPFVPAFREAYARGDYGWFRSAFWRMQRIKFWLSAIGAILFLLLGNIFCRLLSHNQVSFPVSVWLSAGFLLIVGVWNGGFNNLFTAIDRLWILAWLILLNGLVTAPLTYLLGKRFGVVGIINATTAFSAIIAAWLMPVLSLSLWRKIKQSTEGKKNLPENGLSLAFSQKLLN